MKSLYEQLVRAAVGVATSDREEFVERVTRIIEEEEPRTSDTKEEIGRKIKEWIEQVSGENCATARREVLIEKIEALTKSIDQLNKTLSKPKA